ncbi:MAG: hypothetical protein JWQ94_1418 [Tardiphaga sp.]|jgi:hypothetical protein|nr:hypothetical protein [Tardiphaga sp.]
MKRIVVLACTVVMSCAAGANKSDAAMLAPPAKALVSSPADGMMAVSFWAQSYPHGYSGWRRCPDGVRVKTPYGWRCSAAVYREGGPVLRSRG